MSESVDLVGLGLNATDTLISVTAIPSPGSKVDVRSIGQSPGGQVATALVACANWGLRTRYIGKLGDDQAATIHQKAFADSCVETGLRLSAATLGIDGVLAWDGQQYWYSAAYRVPAIDTTGAGDIFHAGFIYGLLNSWPLQRNLDFACAAAALNCTASGARGKLGSVEEIEDLMKNGQRHPPAYDRRNLRTA